MRKQLKIPEIGRLSSQCQEAYTWMTRQDPFVEVWLKIQAQFQLKAGLEAETIFEDLQRRSPGRFKDGQLQTLQREEKKWRVFEGRRQEVFFCKTISRVGQCREA
jgi:hypothetical protein